MLLSSVFGTMSEMSYHTEKKFGCVGGVLRVDAGRRCSTGDGKFFFDCSPTKGQSVDSLGAQIRQLVLEAKQRLRQEQAAKGQAAFTKTVPNGFATAILASAPAHDLCQFRPNPLTTLLGVKNGGGRVQLLDPLFSHRHNSLSMSSRRRVQSFG
ncbi:hypothetical protein SprV_1002906900 [Sparganum proliferum]